MTRADSALVSAKKDETRESHSSPKRGEFGNRLPHAYRISRRDVQADFSKGVPFLLGFLLHREDLLEGDHICRGNPPISENVMVDKITPAIKLTARQLKAQDLQGFVQEDLVLVAAAFLCELRRT